MADSVLAFGIEKLWELVSQEYELFQGVEDQITELKGDLNMLMAFLHDAYAKKQTSALARNCLEEIKEITYDAEDIIETFLLKGSGRREIALEITSISNRISKIIQVMQTLGIKSDIMDGGYSQALLEKRWETRHTFSTESESNLVGLGENVEKLVDELVRNDNSYGVSITGLGGLGKTTLARQIFNHNRVKDHFYGLAWVCVSQDFTRKYVWQTILKNLSHGDYVADFKEEELQKNLSPEDRVSDMNISQKKKISDMDEDELEKNLVHLLGEKKVFIVFDDVWEKEDWDRIKPMFPAERKAGWKVLLTSRNDDVHPQCVTFKPKGLTPDQCCELLRMIAFPTNETTGYIIDKDMENMAKEMTKHCGGLPLAVKVLGGLLAAQHTSRQWKLISENIKSHIVGGVSSSVNDSSSVNYVLSLSFEGLPSYLKHCLLHLASYPEDQRISLRNLSYVWAAEGITKQARHYEGATNIRDVADLYIDELVKRNMVISGRDVVTLRYEVCQLHDLMREICLLKAEEENFLQIVSDPTCSSRVHSQASSKSRRLVVYCTKTFNGERKIKNSKLRSLLFIPVECKFSMGSNFKELPLLRVLDLSFAEFEGGKLPSSIGKLIHLRYLSLYMAKVTHLPSSMRNLKQLLFLNLDVISIATPIYMTNFLKEMRELTYLGLPFKINKEVRVELGNLLKLERLENFSTNHSSVTDLHHMTRLRSLSICISGKGWRMETISSTLGKLGHLEYLIIKSSENLKLPKLLIYMPMLPNVVHFPSHLTIINLDGCFLVEDPMPILEKLLQLKVVSIWNNAYVGRRMDCSDGGFPQLQILEIWRLQEWEEWKVEEGSMPLLHTLKIRSCPKLKKLPHGQRLNFPKLHTLSIWELEELKKLIIEDGSMPQLHTLTIFYCKNLKELPDELTFITSLKELMIGTKEREFKKKVSKGGEDYYKIQHIPLIRYHFRPEPEDNEDN